MKPAPFNHFAPTSVPEAVELLGQHAPDARVLAGGQSLVPMMNFRLARPDVLVDLNRISDLSYIRDDGDFLVIAMTRGPLKTELCRKKMVGDAGIEPATPSMSTKCSPAELIARVPEKAARFIVFGNG